MLAPLPVDVLVSSAMSTLPEVRIPKVEPWEGKKLSASEVPFGEPEGGTTINSADVSVDELATIVWARAMAPAASFETGIIDAANTEVLNDTVDTIKAILTSTRNLGRVYIECLLLCLKDEIILSRFRIAGGSAILISRTWFDQGR
jgi:hypothetical protein